jgi:hypothetical protein
VAREQLGEHLRALRQPVLDDEHGQREVGGQAGQDLLDGMQAAARRADHHDTAHGRLR